MEHRSRVKNRFDRAWRDPRASEGASVDEALFRSVVEFLGDGVAIIGQDDNGESSLVYVNPAFAALTGYSPSDVLGKPFRPDESAFLDRVLQRCLAASQHQNGVSCEVIEGEAGGHRRILQLQSTSLGNHPRKSPYRAVMLRDITADRYSDEAGQRNERLTGIGLLFAGIAHEINNTTAAALLAAETALAIKDLPGAGAQLTACLENIIASADRCGRSVRSLLRYPRDEPAEKQSCCINAVVEHAVDLSRLYAERRRVAVRLDCDPAVPPAPMNPLEIELMLVNLIRNAVKASGGGAEILVRTASVEGGVCVSVSEKGQATAGEPGTRGFDPLDAACKSAEEYEPGLSIAQGIVQRHGGHMQVQSRPGEGTIVTIDLPTGVDSFAAHGQT